jgi:CheY-like chemotaxis protein
MMLLRNLNLFLSRGSISLTYRYLFDFIFMDLILPEMSGYEATNQIRKIEKEFGNIHTNIVAVTVEGRKDLEEEIFDEYCKI